ncbi:MAG: hypothetical protein GY868_14150 [Deltaproteobacteria bacterium]|nr:hypothetical protein [Deltaproteobacteria bacterium]
MELKELKKQIRTLATLPETEAPVISCYLELLNGKINDQDTYNELARTAMVGLSEQELYIFKETLEPINTYLANELLPNAKGAAIFSRAGSTPFFLPLQFRVSLPNWISLSTTPNIYHLVEMKDTYHRYVVMISMKKSACIVEVNLGEVTAQLWQDREDLRERVGREWTKEHYQKHSRERGKKFIKEKINLLDKLMSAGGHTHLILAGHPTMTSRIKNELPKCLLEKLVNEVTVSGHAKANDVVEATIASFVEAEEIESQHIAEILSHKVGTGGLAVAGAEASFQALQRGHVDTVVLLAGYSPGQFQMCFVCGFANPKDKESDSCPQCGSNSLKISDLKEEMVRLAEGQGCLIEVVNESESLVKLGGVGCLLRYRL